MTLQVERYANRITTLNIQQRQIDSERKTATGDDFDNLTRLYRQLLTRERDVYTELQKLLGHTKANTVINQAVALAYA